MVEIKGYRGEDAKEKKATMDSYWVPGVNNLGRHGRWAFVEFTDVWTIQDNFSQQIERAFEAMLDQAVNCRSNGMKD